MTIVDTRPNQKVCTVCASLKPMAEFGRTTSTHRDRRYIQLRGECNECRRAKDNARYVKLSTDEREAKFWSTVWDRIEKTDSCWIWRGTRNSAGYGVITRSQNKQYRVTHLVYGQLVGHVPPGFWMLHHCDNPPCCNPAHLYVGTALENNRDTAARGRHAKQKQRCLS